MYYENWYYVDLNPIHKVFAIHTELSNASNTVC